MLNKIFVKEVIGPIIIIILFTLLYLMIKKIIKKSMKIKLSKIDKRRQKTINLLILNILKYLLIIIALVIILSIYGINMNAVITSLGIVGLVFGLAFQGIIKDFLSGISIIIENQYGVGDIVTINGFKGEVLFIGFRTTRLKAYTGEILIISNGNITEVINHSFANSLAIVDISISYDENIKKVEKVLQNIAINLKNETEDINGKVEVLGINKLGDSAIEYRMTAETVPTKNLVVQRIILKKIKLEFDKHKIDIPYNQLVIHNE